MTAPAAEPVARASVPVKLFGIVLAGAAVSVALGVYGRVHDPTHEQPYTWFFTSTIQLKVWFATVALALAIVQVLLGLRLYDKISVPRHVPGWLGDAHRLVGTLAFVVTLPVAYQCLWALGFQSTDTRVLVHSLLGCFFYGIFTVKVLSVRVRGLPGPTLPIAGGLAFTVLVGVWLTSALWFLTSRPAGLPAF
jgi:hypothetical protein